MNFEKSLKNSRLVGIDTNIFIYHFANHPEFILQTKILFNLLQKSKIKAVTSMVTLTELLSLPGPPKILRNLEEAFFTIPNLTISEVDRQIAKEAGRVRRIYGFRTPDSIQLATALTSKANKFITNDRRLKNFREIKIELLAK